MGCARAGPWRPSGGHLSTSAGSKVRAAAARAPDMSCAGAERSTLPSSAACRPARPSAPAPAERAGGAGARTRISSLGSAGSASATSSVATNASNCAARAAAASAASRRRSATSLRARTWRSWGVSASRPPRRCASSELPVVPSSTEPRTGEPAGPPPREPARGLVERRPAGLPTRLGLPVRLWRSSEPSVSSRAS